MKSFLSVSLLLVFFSQACNNLSGKVNSESVNEVSSGPVIQIIFTGEENGHLEPCGCSEKQLGGFSKRQTFVDKLRQKDEHLILLSLGDLPGKVGRQDEIKMETALDALDRMGYVVHNIGEKDLDMGAVFLGYLSQVSNIDFLSSNIVDFSTQVLKIRPYVIKEIKMQGMVARVGILGILSPELIENVSREFEVENPIVSLKPLLSNLHEKTDILILLSHAAIDESVRIAEACPEIDLIISGHRVDRPDLYIKKINKTYIVPVGEKGKYAGTVAFSLQKRLTNENGHVFNRLIPSIKTIPIDERFEDSTEMKTVLSIYQQRVRDEDLLAQVFKSDLPSHLTFVGNDVCALCHRKIYNHWKETGHAVAYETLVKVEHESDPECVECHVIGLKYFSGFETIESTPELKGVGCESCHGPGSSHKETQSKDYGKVTVMTCEICHEDEHSPNFAFQRYWQKIMHPGEEK